jgi:hypothetical protein
VLKETRAALAFAKELASAGPMENPPPEEKH